MKNIFEGNRKWVAKNLQNDPNYYKELSLGQQPEYLYIGCSDSRVPANEISGTRSGDIFVHRNIANMVVHTDMNLLSVLQYAVEVLKVRHVIVTGHYGCGGVKAAMSDQQFGLIDNWLRNIKDVIRMHKDKLDAITDEEEKFKRLVELNVIEQVNNLNQTSVIQNALKSDNPVEVHGLVYSLQEGLLKELDIETFSFKDVDSLYNLNVKETVQ